MTFAEVRYSLSRVANHFQSQEDCILYSYFAIRINLCLYFIHVNCNTVLCNTFFMYHTVVTCRLKMTLIKMTQDFLSVNQGKEESVAQFEDQQQLTKRRKYQYPNVYKQCPSILMVVFFVTRDKFRKTKYMVGVAQYKVLLLLEQHQQQLSHHFK